MPGIDVEVRVELLHHDAETRAVEKIAETGGGEALTEEETTPHCDENVLRHRRLELCRTAGSEIYPPRDYSLSRRAAACAAERPAAGGHNFAQEIDPRLGVRISDLRERPAMGSCHHPFRR